MPIFEHHPQPVTDHPIYSNNIYIFLYIFLVFLYFCASAAPQWPTCSCNANPVGSPRRNWHAPAGWGMPDSNPGLQNDSQVRFQWATTPPRATTPPHEPPHPYTYTYRAPSLPSFLMLLHSLHIDYFRSTMHVDQIILLNTKLWGLLKSPEKGWSPGIGGLKFG